MIYLDNAATTLRKPPGVAQAITEAMGSMGNAGRGAHAPTLQASRVIYETREALAELFHISDPTRIAFTSNGTEALNTAINGILKPGGHVITTECEHNSVLRPLYRMMDERRDWMCVGGGHNDMPVSSGLAGHTGLRISYLKADHMGRLDYGELEKCRQPDTQAVVITHASNLTGNITDLKKVSAFTKKYGILLIVDAAQTAGVVPINVEELGIDVLCFTGHKGLLGPQGTGGIYVRGGVEIAPLKTGGSGVHSYDRKHPAKMPAALEAGTLNGHGIAGLRAALAYLKEAGIDALYQRERALARRFYMGVKEIPGVVLYGDYEAEDRVGIVSLNIGDLDSALASDWLWEDYEICTRPGAHCAPLLHQAFGTVGQGIVRFSFSHFNTEEEADIAVQAVRELAE